MSTSTVSTTSPFPHDLTGVKAFIETQWPVSKLSKESYKERMAGSSQTLTGQGKWWGRKPLVLVRAIILGLLLPASEDPVADRAAFLALMTMDDAGMIRRLKSSIPLQLLYDFCTSRERKEYFVTTPKLAWQSKIDRTTRQQIMTHVFLRMSYDQRLKFCFRPDEVEGPGLEAWEGINAHLGTQATNLAELVSELGQRRFGHTPRVGDVFSGGGSIPFEAARIGCEAYGSDLNPVAALLTWGALNVVGGGPAALEQVTATQKRVFAAVQAQVDVWGIERNEDGWIAEAFLYCNEALDPATGWRVPLAPSWNIAPKFSVAAQLIPIPEEKRFAIDIIEQMDEDAYRTVDEEGTWKAGICSPVDKDGNWIPTHLRQATSTDRLRGANGLRLWETTDIVPRPGDIFQERLYCIRWIDPKTNERHYRAPTQSDLEREKLVLALLQDRFSRWQDEGFIPSMKIESGYNTDQPIRERGWTHWHHLFNPRQLLVIGLFAEVGAKEDPDSAKWLCLMIGKLIDWNSRLCRWDTVTSPGIGFGIQTFYNQALNTFVNYSCRSMNTLKNVYFPSIISKYLYGTSTLQLTDARQIDWHSDIWITDPGYGDVIHYDELSEYFLAWYDKQLTKLFPNWYSDSKRAMAVKGEGADFRVTLAECYRHIAKYMSDDGYQVVMFTHQNPEIWADLTLVLWAAGLQVRAAWTIATETSGTGIKQGNYVQGTVNLVLRKRRNHERGDFADIFPDVQHAVRQQVRTMLALDPKDDPNFGDADYQLAAYAAALRILTAYKSIGDIDVERELRRNRGRNETSLIAGLIERAVRIASDELIPAGLDERVWRRLIPDERLYVKGIAVESQGDSREGVYQELARGYGATDYRALLASRSANRTRLKAPSEFAARDLSESSAANFSGSLLRFILYAIYVVAKDNEQGPQQARNYLRSELPDYWGVRSQIIGLLQYLIATAMGLTHWQIDLKAAELLLGSIQNDAI